MIDNEKLTNLELEKILEKYELERIHAHVFEKIMLLVIASLGLITALAWDTALTHLFRKLFGRDTLAEELSYALIITLIAAVVSVLLGRATRPKPKGKL